MSSRSTYHNGSHEGKDYRTEWKRQWHANFDRGHRSMFELRLPNGRSFSFSLGQLIFFGLLVWWLPFNWLLLGVVLFAAYHIGKGSEGSWSSHQAEDSEMPKRKNDEPIDEDEIAHV